LSTEGFSPLKNIPEKIITLAKKEFIISEKY
jgi:hypothetical protein